jgi:hypothetical protein
MRYRIVVDGREISTKGRAPEITQAAYDAACRYRDQHGDLLVPDDYEDPDTGLKLGVYLGHRRALRKAGELDAEQVAVWDALGMEWDPLEAAWAEAYRYAVHYRATRGDLLVPRSYTVPGAGFELGKWIARQRAVRRGQRTGSLTPERIAKLDSLGMVWHIGRTGLNPRTH